MTTERRQFVGPLAGAMATGLAREVMEALISTPQIPVRHDNARVIEPYVERAVERAVQDQIKPRIEHVTNTEPWYQSRVTLGALASILSGAAAIAGYSVGADSIVEILVAAGPIIGGLLALWGRWAATKPLFS